MKKCLLCLLALCLLLLSLPALAEDTPQVQVVYTNVNFRSTPGGHVIGRFQGGELLTYYEEKHSGGYLWYYVKSEEYGDGYINATCAMPYVEGEPHWGDEDYSPLSPSLRQYTLDLAGWKLEHHVGGWNECNEFSTTRQDEWDAVLPAADIVDMMLENHIMLRNSQTEPFTSATTEEEREKAALKILKIHYNVDSVQELLFRTPKYPNNIGFGDDLIQLEDWHQPYPPTSQEFGSMYKEIHKAYRPEGQ
ncbi:MAG: hypothetical protein Q4B32_11175 [Clostridia bacterium]|nr:hypothetical protein [Clostridia bacterium]